MPWVVESLMLTLDLGCPAQTLEVAKGLSGAGESPELSGDRQVSLNEARPPGEMRAGLRQGSGDPVETPPHPPSSGQGSEPAHQRGQCPGHRKATCPGWPLRPTPSFPLYWVGSLGVGALIHSPLPEGALLPHFTYGPQSPGRAAPARLALDSGSPALAPEAGCASTLQSR